MVRRCEVEGVAELLLGVVLVAFGAVGATMTQRRLDEEGRSTVAPVFLAPFGVLIGAGAAVARGWDVVVAILVGAVVVPIVGVVGRLVEVRRGRSGPGERR
jgi:CHASE2 domain-containing sensor protein